MNIALFIHGKASAGKDYFVKSLKYEYFNDTRTNYPYNGSEMSEKEELLNLYTGKPSIFDTPAINTMPFADEVRRELCRLDPSVDFDRLCRDYSYKTAFRKQLIEIGDGYRQEDPGVWVDKHRKSLQAWNETNNNKIICIPDMRYHTPNHGSEFDYAKEVGSWGNIISIRIKIHAPLCTRLLRMSKEGIASYVQYGMHNASETSMDHVPNEEFNLCIENSANVFYGSLPLKMKDALRLQILPLHYKIRM